MRLVFSLFVIIAIGAVAHAGNGNGDKDAATRLSKVVETERAFAKRSSVVGHRDAFIEYFSDDVATFPPGKPARTGKAHLLAQPSAVDFLSWGPTNADVSRAGDLGFTTGPWEWRDKGTDATPSATGHYITVWKRQGDGNYKAMIDIGVTDPGDTPIPNGLEPKAGWAPKADAGTGAMSAMKDGFLAAENAFEAAAASGDGSVYASHGADSVVLFRENARPIVGAKAARDAVAAAKISATTWTVNFGDVSQSGDLGYVYGVGETRYADGRPAEPVHFARIWKRQPDGAWKVVVDVAAHGPAPASTTK